jgi:hypothetical protein
MAASSNPVENLPASKNIAGSYKTTRRPAMQRKFTAPALLLLTLTTLAGCGHTPGERALSGGAIGAGSGAAIGAVTGAGPATGALIGGGVGAIGGAVTTNK